MIPIALMIACLIPSTMNASEIPRPEHPRPDRVRSEWLSLNGVWEFAETDDDQALFQPGVDFPDRIVVPFCRESPLSGLNRKGFVRNVGYRRKFRVPSKWKSDRVILHFGAVDWRTALWVNGVRVGSHVGGSAPFSFDITERLREGENEVVVHAFDDPRSGLQALGKQSSRPESHGIFYTRTTGIWQSVWIEGVGESYIEDFVVTPNLQKSRFELRAEIKRGSANQRLRAEVFEGDRRVAQADSAGDWRHPRLELPLADPKLWSPASPHLYRLRLTLWEGDRELDRIDSYAGMREVTLRGAAILINGEPTFQRLVLDQGFYPDGVWTAPTDEALRRDIELAQAAGFNGARLHQKVFEPRFLYWADKLGYLVWGEAPSYGANYALPEVNLPILDEWVEVLRRDRNHPSIIGWCPFNETMREAIPLQYSVVELTKQIDPTRPVIETSGWAHGHPYPEVLDAHDYEQDPGVFRARWRDRFSPDSALPSRYSRTPTVPFMISEYGGIGWDVGGGWGYGNVPKSLDEFYSRYQGLAEALLDHPRMFGFCYTQLTDVEQERNGLFTFDRRPKFDLERLRAINSRAAAYEKSPPLSLGAPIEDGWRVIVGAHPDGERSRAWKFTFETPPQGWEAPGFDDASWSSGHSGFGRKEGWEPSTRTPWTTSDLYVRQRFDWDGRSAVSVRLVVHYDNATTVYLNGAVLWRSSEGAWNDRYEGFDVTDSFLKAVRPGGNVLGVHCHQDEGGQFLDLALLVR